jgi:hypothetical protein
MWKKTIKPSSPRALEAPRVASAACISVSVGIAHNILFSSAEIAMKKI